MLILATASQPFLFCLPVSVHGSPAAAPHACQAPTGLDLPAPRPSETNPPFHLHPGRVSGPPLDPQVHWGCHYFPCHGEKRQTCSQSQSSQFGALNLISNRLFWKILALVAVRKAMDYVFSQHDLSYLDDVIPEKDKKKKEDEKTKKNKKKGSLDSEIDFVRKLILDMINISVYVFVSRVSSRSSPLKERTTCLIYSLHPPTVWLPLPWKYPHYKNLYGDDGAGAHVGG